MKDPTTSRVRRCRQLLYDFVWPIHDECPDDDHGDYNGQMLDTDLFNVVVGGNKC